MKELKGSKTEQNLMSAFVGECMASVKYGFYASKAKKDGYIQIHNIFAQTARNEVEHAKIWFKYMNGPIKETLLNLHDAANGEMYEFDKMYPEFAKVAQEEGFAQIAQSFRDIAAIENNHGQRYTKLAKNIENNQVFSSTKPIQWICQNCGHIHIGIQAPDNCPVCSHPKAYFEQNCDNY